MAEFDITITRKVYVDGADDNVVVLRGIVADTDALAIRTAERMAPQAMDPDFRVEAVAL